MKEQISFCTKSFSLLFELSETQQNILINVFENLSQCGLTIYFLKRLLWTAEVVADDDDDDMAVSLPGALNRDD